MSLAIFILLVAGLPRCLCAQQLSAQLPISAPAQAGMQLPDAPSQSLAGSITGTVVDRDGAFVSGARVSLNREGQTAASETITGSDGRFSFTEVPAGFYSLGIFAAGFIPQQIPGELLPGQAYEAPEIVLPNASANIEVEVTATQEEIAQAQIEEEEKQRIFGIIPNFYVSYVPSPVPLNPRQKFELAWKSLIDPTSFAAAGLVAGIQQSQNDFSGYGQGTLGFSKRFAASYGNVLTGTLIGSAILPIVFKQDPRYFYKGTGSIRSRIVYALEFAVFCKGDNGKWQFNYSGVLGTLASSGISNAYYPAANRNGAGLTFANLGIGFGGTAATNLFQEFLIPRLTTHGPHSKSKAKNTAKDPAASPAPAGSNP